MKPIEINWNLKAMSRFASEHLRKQSQFRTARARIERAIVEAQDVRIFLLTGRDGPYTISESVTITNLEIMANRQDARKLRDLLRARIIDAIAKAKNREVAA